MTSRTKENDRPGRGARAERAWPAALLLVIVACGAARAQTAPEAKALFSSRCYSCHNIIGGDKQGPDLKGLTDRRTKEWLHEFIKKPAAMNSRGDATARELFRKYSPHVMPDQAVTPAEIDSILALIGELTKSNQQFIPEGARLSRAIAPSDVDGGANLFTGRWELAGRGTSCISCHNVRGAGIFGGGTLGPDLTAVNARYRDPELISILQNPNFPTMNSIFATRPLNDEEIVKLFAFFQSAKAGNVSSRMQTGVAQIEPKFLMTGVVALILALAAINQLWRNRLRGVREPLVRRSMRRTAP